MKFTISSFSFSVSEPYTAGHPISDSEAKALNSARADRIRESARRWIVDEQRKLGREDLPEETLSALQTRIIELDSTFVFGQHGPRAKSNLTVEAEARALAEAQIEAWAGSGEASEEEIESIISALASDPRIIDEARRRVAAKNQVAREAIEAML